MNDLDITQGQWRSGVAKVGGKTVIKANGKPIAEVLGSKATEDAAVMASAPRLYDVLTDILIFLKDPKNKAQSAATERKWSGIQRRVQDVLGTLPKRQ